MGARVARRGCGAWSRLIRPPCPPPFPAPSSTHCSFVQQRVGCTLRAVTRRAGEALSPRSPWLPALMWEDGQQREEGTFDGVGTETRLSQQLQIKFEMGMTSGPGGLLCLCVYQREGGGRPREERRGPRGGGWVWGQDRARPGRGDLSSREWCFCGRLADDITCLLPAAVCQVLSTRWHFGFSQRPCERGPQYPLLQTRRWRLEEAVCPRNGKMIVLEGARHVQAPPSRASPTP